MITREQLELAAKAAGLDARKMYDYGDAFGYCLPTQDPQQFIPWAPHINHGQLLDLAMACEIRIDPINNIIDYYVDGAVEDQYYQKLVDCQGFPALAEAVITAAAEQQQAKEKKE